MDLHRHRRRRRKLGVNLHRMRRIFKIILSRLRLFDWLRLIRDELMRRYRRRLKDLLRRLRWLVLTEKIINLRYCIVLIDLAAHATLASLPPLMRRTITRQILRTGWTLLKLCNQIPPLDRPQNRILTDPKQISHLLNTQ